MLSWSMVFLSSERERSALERELQGRLLLVAVLVAVGEGLWSIIMQRCAVEEAL
jgi:hypothetical protein